VEDDRGHHQHEGAADRQRLNDRFGSDRGTGLLATYAAVVVFLAFLLFAVQLMVDEYAMTATTSAAFDGARIVAGSRVDQTDRAAVASARQQAETRMRHELGAFGRSVAFDWSASTADAVVLRVVGDAPRFLWPGLQHELGLGHVDRTVRVRIERWR
jgi:hypothetical protein